MSGDSQAVRLERVSTGVEGLDEILGGGIPAKSITVVSGEPGSGKTVLALQMLFHAARQGKRSLSAGQLPEFAIADGIVRLGTAPHDLTRIRVPVAAGKPTS